MGEMKLEKIRQAIPLGRSKVMKEHWENIKKTLPYKQLKRHLQDQLNRYGNRHFASKNLQKATQLHNAHNYIEAKRIKKDLLEQAQAGREISPDIQIASLIKSKPQ
jgi:parvulin-like peptidyl-prolyl isomerase